MARHKATSNGHGEGLPADRAAAAVSLGRGATVSEAARIADVDRTTVHRWLKDDPAFIAAVNREKHDLAEELRQQRRELAGEAVQALRRLLNDPSASIRLRAAQAALESVGKADAIPDAGETDPEAIRKAREPEPPSNGGDDIAAVVSRLSSRLRNGSH